MRDFERTDLNSVRKQIEDNVGFVVGDHNYGRVDNMSSEELDTVAKSVGALVQQAEVLLDAIGIVSFERHED
jgi:hypothetical protein